MSSEEGNGKDGSSGELCGVVCWNMMGDTHDLQRHPGVNLPFTPHDVRLDHHFVETSRNQPCKAFSVSRPYQVSLTLAN